MASHQFCGLIKNKKMKKRIVQFLALVAIVLNYTTSTAQVVDPVGKDKIANGGYDMVSYFTDDAAMKGSKEYTAEYKGVKYQFTSAEHQKMFKSAPEKYLPACDGY